MNFIKRLFRRNRVLVVPKCISEETAQKLSAQLYITVIRVPESSEVYSVQI